MEVRLRNQLTLSTNTSHRDGYKRTEDRRNADTGATPTKREEPLNVAGHPSLAKRGQSYFLGVRDGDSHP